MLNKRTHKIFTGLLILFVLVFWLQQGIQSRSQESGILTSALFADTLITEIKNDSTKALTYINFNPGIAAINPVLSQQKAFQLGENLQFKIRYGFVKAGEAEMNVLTLAEYNNQKVYHIQTRARSVTSFDWIYKVRDEVNSFIDYYGLYPLRFEKKLREGSYKADLFVDYFHEDSLARVESIRYEKNMNIRNRKTSQVTIPPYVNDILSAFYVVRNQDLKTGSSLYLFTNEKDKVYDLEVKIYSKEIIQVEAGTFRCFYVEPLLQGEGIFKQKGRLRVWLSDDQYKIPIQMTSEVLIGHITTELVKIKGIDLPLPSQMD
jgi:hypothetical protein